MNSGQIETLSRPDVQRGIHELPGLAETSAAMRVAADANLGLRLCVELGAYASLGYWGTSTGGSTTARTSLAIAAPLIAIIMWSLLLAPKAKWHLSEPAALVLELSIFATAAIALASSGPIILATVFGVVAAGNTLLLRFFRRGRQEATGGVKGEQTR